MISTVRQIYNEAFSNERYQDLLQAINEDLPGMLDFRIAETPVFVPKELKEKLISACDHIVDVITADNFRELTDKAIPRNDYVPNEDNHAGFLAIDFAVCRNEASGELEPQLIELQGFPSLFGFQAYIPGQFRHHFPVPESYTSLFNVADREEYLEELQKLIVGEHDPEHVILLEIYPEQQKTRIDFELTRRFLGVEPVCLTKIRKEGRALFYEKDGRRIPVKRIYNRLIFDDLQRFVDIETEFRPTDDVDVEWVCHPNWFFRISKYTLPLFDSPFVPKSHFLSDLDAYPEDLENYVLKPLFSFAGSGVQLHISADDLDAIPPYERHNFLLQRKVSYEPVIQSPDGLVKCEIRMLFIWHKDDDQPKLVTNLARLSRGEMIGVNFNKNKDWVGGSVCFFEP